MDASLGWSKFFLNWPEQWNRQGVLVTTFGEQIPFDGFMVSEDLLFLQRSSPDAIGTRQLLLAYHNISALKINNVVKAGALAEKGFSGTMPKK